MSINCRQVTCSSLSRIFFLMCTFVFSLSLLNGCTFGPHIPKTLGENQTSYSYIPLDPLPVSSGFGKSCRDEKSTLKKLLDSLPDQAVRIAVGQYNASGNLVYGPAKVGLEGNSYQIVLDYINVDAANVPVYIERWTEENGQKKLVSVYDDSFNGNSQYRVQRDPVSDLYSNISKSQAIPVGDKVNVPVYLGVGLRLTASVTITKGSVGLSSLGVIAANAEAGKLSGSLVVQTLGITGKSVSTTLPLPSELNQTTIQNAILSLGSIKAILYDPNTEITPRVVGIYNPIGGGQQVVNGIISILASDPIRWYRPCVGTI